jgi:uncharacterized membrane protein YqjE
MDHDRPNEASPGSAAKRLALGLLSIARTRFQLLGVELQEERERWLLSLVLVLGCAACGFLAFMALTIGCMAVLWPHSPLLAVALPSGTYAVAAFCLYRRIRTLFEDWQSLPDTLEQLRKDRECLETWLD